MRALWRDPGPTSRVVGWEVGHVRGVVPRRGLLGGGGVSGAEEGVGKLADIMCHPFSLLLSFHH